MMKPLILLLVLIVGTMVSAVDRSKFRTCDQTFFCRKNRGASSNVANPSLRHLRPAGPDAGNTAVEGELWKSAEQDPRLDDGQQAQLHFELHSLQPNVFRVRVTEPNPGRYEGPLEFLNLPDESQRIPLILNGQLGGSDKSDDLTLNFSQSGTAAGGVCTNAFEMTFSLENQEVLHVNKLGTFGFEQRRGGTRDAGIPAEIPDPDASQPEEWDSAADGAWEPPMIENPALKDRWEESFSSWTDHKKHGPQDISLDFAFPGSTHIYGLPEHADSLALRRTAGDESDLDPYRLFNLDVFEYELESTMALYGAVPFVIAHNEKSSVGVFWFNSAETWVDVGDEEEESGSLMGSLFGSPKSVYTHFISESGVMDFFVLLGPTPLDVIRQYATLTGVAPLPPLFAISYHQCKWNYKTQAEVAEVDTAFDDSDIPYDVLWLDIEHTKEKRYFTYDLNVFPDPAGMIDSLAAKGRKMVNIIDPHIKKDDGYHIYAAFQEKNFFVKDRDGNDYEGTCWPGDSKWIDYLNPEASSLWAEQFRYDKYDFSKSSLFVWNDMNEPSVFSGPEVTMDKSSVHFGGFEHRDVHNAYGMYYHRATFNGLLGRNDKQDARPFVLTRSFFSGSQRYAAIWTGDNDASWGHLAASVPMLLSLNVGGISFSGADVGGFFGNTEVELLTRWYQAGAFQPFFRAHGILEARRKEPFLFGEPHKSIMQEAIRSRYAHLPYWYTVFRDHMVTTAPVMRPLWVMYPTETGTFGIDDQHLVGGDVMVKPVTEQGKTETEVYFPGAEPWYDAVTGNAYAPGSSRIVAAPLEKIPVYYRGGSIIPKKERVRRCSASMVNDPYTLVVSLSAAGSAEGHLYVDDGWSYNYTAGKYLHRRFSFEGNVLSASGIAGDAGQLHIDNLVERVVFFGLSGVTKAVASVGGRSYDIPLLERTLQDSDGGFYGIKWLRQPGLPVSADWKVQLGQ